MRANYQAITYNPYVSHITEEAIRRTQEREPRSKILEAYSHLQECQGSLGKPDGEQQVSFNLHIIGEEDGKHRLILTHTEEGIQYEAGEEVIVRIFNNMDAKDTESLNILEGPGAKNKGLLTRRQFLTAVSSGHQQAAEGLAYACAYVKED